MLLLAVLLWQPLMLLWQPVAARDTVCSAAYSQTGLILTDHVIETHNGSDVVKCSESCDDNRKCYSMNLWPQEGRCELNNATHLSHPSKMTLSRDGGYNLINQKRRLACSVVLCCGENATATCTQRCQLGEDGVSYQCLEIACAERPLGMEDGRIPDNKITAASHSTGRDSFYGRLNNPDGSWSMAPRTADTVIYFGSVWLQVDLSHVMHVAKVATQGSPVLQQWIMKYAVWYSVDPTTWLKYGDDNGRMLQLGGNSNQDTVVSNILSPMIKARYVRIVPVQYRAHVSARVELYGCPLKYSTQTLLPV